MNSGQLPQLECQRQPGSTLVLRLSFQNQMNEALLLRPTLEDWVVDRDRVLMACQSLEPPYLYLFPSSDASQTMTISIPSELLPGQKLTTGLRFPGIQEEAIPLNLEIVSFSQPLPPVLECPLRVTFPISRETKASFSHTFDATTAGILGLISAMIDLDKIPTRWLVAELLIAIAQTGEEYARTLPGSQLREDLKRTAFFKNGAMALASAQLPEWLSEAIAIANSSLGSNGQTPRTQRLLYIWERWLLSLADVDVEANEIGNPIVVPPFNAEAIVAELGMDAERWFGSFLLGLAVLSPRWAQALAAIAEIVPPNAPNDTKAADAGYLLTTVLPGLNFLPVRWLVVELLFILAQIGQESAKCAAGRSLSHRLSRTRFFKNGVVALALAKVPRWLQISQSASTAFATSIGVVTGMGGMLAFWEQWLWRLLPAHSEFQLQIPPHSAGEALSAELGMNSDRWFEAIILGLAVISPRIAAILDAIASLAPPPPPPPTSLPTPVEDIIGESQSLQR